MAENAENIEGVELMRICKCGKPEEENFHLCIEGTHYITIQAQKINMQDQNKNIKKDKFIIDTDSCGEIEMEADCINLCDGNLEVIKDHFVIAIFKEWNHFMKKEKD